MGDAPARGPLAKWRSAETGAPVCNRPDWLGNVASCRGRLETGAPFWSGFNFDMGHESIFRFNNWHSPEKISARGRSRRSRSPLPVLAPRSSSFPGIGRRETGCVRWAFDWDTTAIRKPPCPAQANRRTGCLSNPPRTPKANIVVGVVRRVVVARREPRVVRVVVPRTAAQHTIAFHFPVASKASQSSFLTRSTNAPVSACMACPRQLFHRLTNASRDK